MAFEGGVVASTIRVSKRVYVPGATRVGLSSVISRIDRRSQTVYLGRVAVSAAKLNIEQLSVGDYITIEGMQPQVGGDLISE